MPPRPAAHGASAVEAEGSRQGEHVGHGQETGLALGLIGFVAEFIPCVKPILAAVPALLVAFTQGPDLALWTLAGYLAIHQVEGNVVSPLIQRRIIVIPPALMPIGIASVGSLFGYVGVFFAGPLVAMLYAGKPSAAMRARA